MHVYTMYYDTRKRKSPGNEHKQDNTLMGQQVITGPIKTSTMHAKLLSHKGGHRRSYSLKLGTRVLMYNIF